MVLEATMLVLDNSEWMRNGDYTPTRWEAQADAVSMIFDAKTNSNPESEVGLMTMAGKSPEVLVTLTQDIGKILGALHRSKIVGSADLATGINVASLALKHRQNKNQRQRVVVFVGSPVEQSEEDLVKLGKKLKKNNIAVDIVSFGEDAENEEKLSKFIEAVNSAENSHLLSVPAGPQLLSDIILSSPVLQEEGGDSGAGPSGSSGGSNQFEFGVDPSMDPELAMALRLSLEEEQARQRASEGASGSQAPTLPTVSEGAEVNATASVGASSAVSTLPGSGSMVLRGAESITGEGHNVEDESEEAMLQKAISLSRASETSHTNDGDVDMTSAEPSAGRRAVVVGQGEGEEDEEMDEDEAIARAIQMSLQEGDGQDDSK
uniref:Putative 26S proteasome regulatory subunit Rpn10 n=1 Tax=Ustilago esculenta TaxID=185366 RepID=A0A481SFT9_9BASI|nr:putative 26S proteasome regulatory subunit Rpn10 [Ustilago esculenta]